MELINIKRLFELYPIENAVEGCKIKCLSCGKWSKHSKFIETVAFCDSCGEHDAMVCPKCDELFDHVNCDPFECKI